MSKPASRRPSAGEGSAPPHSLSPMFYAQPSVSNASSSSSSSPSRAIGTPPPRRASKDSLYDLTPAPKASPQGGDYFSQSPSPVNERSRGNSKGKGVIVRTPSGTKLTPRRSSSTNGSSSMYFPPPPQSTGSPLPVPRPASRRNSGARPMFPERSNTGSPQQQTSTGEVVRMKYTDQAKIVSYNFAKSDDGWDLPNEWVMTIEVAPGMRIAKVKMADNIVKKLDSRFPHWNSPTFMAAAQQLWNITSHARLGVDYWVTAQNRIVSATAQSVEFPEDHAEPFRPQTVEQMVESGIQAVQNSFRQRVNQQKQKVNQQKRNALTDPRVSSFLSKTLNLQYVEEKQAEEQKPKA